MLTEWKVRDNKYDVNFDAKNISKRHHAHKFYSWEIEFAGHAHKFVKNKGQALKTIQLNYSKLQN